MAWQPDPSNENHFIGGSVGFYTFKSLNDLEEEAFRQHARDNDPEDLSRWSIYHPVCREEWEKRGIHP